ILRVARHFGICVGSNNPGAQCSSMLDCPGGACETRCVDAPGTMCDNDGDCPSGACGAPFDLASLTLPGGTLLLPRPFVGNGICEDTVLQSSVIGCNADCGGNGPCVTYALEAQNPVALSSLAVQTNDVRSFTMSEALELKDRNVDGDMIDTV